MDEFARFNKTRWEALAAANVDYSRPALTLDTDAARRMIDPHGVMGDVAGKNVLCLASGGGQQSAAFGLLGATVTVLDLSETQLERDSIALTHYGLRATLVQGDMRDLSRFDNGAFDIVWHAFSINFIPDTAPVFDEVRRVLGPNGLYRLEWHNPFTVNMTETSWTGEGYLIKRPYGGGEIQFDSPYWDVTDLDGTQREIEGPHEFNHPLSTVVNGLIERGFVLAGIWEARGGNVDAAPGTWDHFLSVVSPYLTLWATYRSEAG